MKLQKLTFVIGSFVILCLSFVYLSSLLKKPQDLKIIFLDVGQGDSILILTPMKKVLLIDAGGGNDIDRKINTYLPINKRTLDMLFFTHPDLDHVGGALSLFRRFKIKNLFHSGLFAGNEVYEAIANYSHKALIPSRELSLGDTFMIEPGLSLVVFSPHPELRSYEANDYSLVMKLVYHNTSVLLTGDATQFIENELINIFGNNLESDILKVGHHGSNTSTSAAFLDAVHPEYAVLSYGCTNSYGHPHPNVVSTLYKKKVQVLDTCMMGDIVFRSDGENFFLETTHIKK